MRRLLIGLLLLLGCVSPLHADIELSAYLGSLTEVTSTATTDYLAILRGTTLYKIKPGNIAGAGITATLGADISIIMGDTGGANKVKFLDSDSVEMGSINSDGVPTFGTDTGVVYATSGAYSPVSSISGASVEVDTASRIVCSDANKKIIACSAATGTGAPVKAVSPSLTSLPKVVLTNNTTNEYYGGTAINFAQCAASMGFGQPAYIQSTGKPGLADGDGVATMPAIGLVVVASTDADTPCTILTHGVITNTDWNWTVGNTIYVADGDAGALTATVGDLSDTNDVVQKIGIAIHADSILVMPSLTTIVLE